MSARPDAATRTESGRIEPAAIALTVVDLLMTTAQRAGPLHRAGLDIGTKQAIPARLVDAARDVGGITAFIKSKVDPQGPEPNSPTDEAVAGALWRHYLALAAVRERSSDVARSRS